MYDVPCNNICKTRELIQKKARYRMKKNMRGNQNRWYINNIQSPALRTKRIRVSHWVLWGSTLGIRTNMKATSFGHRMFSPWGLYNCWLRPSRYRWSLRIRYGSWRNTSNHDHRQEQPHQHIWWFEEAHPIIVCWQENPRNIQREKR